MKESSDNSLLILQTGPNFTFLSFSLHVRIGFSAVAICVGVAVVLVISVAAIFGASAMKKRKPRSRGRVRVYKTRPGITIKIFPATPKENRSEVSLNNETVTPSNLVPPKPTSRFRVPTSWMKWS